MTYPGVYVDEVPDGGRAIVGVATSIAAFVGRALSGPENDPVTITSFGDFERAFGGLGLACPMSYAVRDFFLNGGAQAIVVRLDGDPAGSPADKTGLFALEKADLFNLLCIPPDTRAGTTLPAVYQTALAYCEARRAMLIVDPPAHWETVAAARDGLGKDIALTGPAARNAALYFPRLIQADPLLGGRLDSFVPSGAVAGIMARTDAQRGVWKAPAGTGAVLHGTQDLSVKMTHAENRLLTPLGINSLRTFPIPGPVVWGARTLRGADQHADEYKYIPVRRLALYIEESLDRGTQWAVFEPNGEPLWSRIRLQVGAFMQSLFTQGAFQGNTPREAYFVKVDRETTTQNDIDLGVVNIVVGFAPLKPAEFVIIRIQKRFDAAPAATSTPVGDQGKARMERLAQRLRPAATWKDLALPDDELRRLRRLADEVARRTSVSRQRRKRGLGIGALFTGESGTGKTTAAEALANHLRLDLYRIDLSAVVSKHIGETEKNLARVFHAAGGGGAILYFDEADALFGKRTDVRDSHDRYANTDIDYLLQRVESYHGLTILATNRKGALDRAFIRRLHCVIDFPFPSGTQCAADPSSGA